MEDVKAWDGRWLVVWISPATAQAKAHYMVQSLDRAGNQYDAAALAQRKFSLPPGVHLMVVALPPHLVQTAQATSAEPEVPGPRWFRVSTNPNPPSSGPQLEAVSETTWLDEVAKQWTSPPAEQKAA